MSGSGVYPKTAEGSAFAEGATWQRQKDSGEGNFSPLAEKAPEEVYQEVYKSHIKTGGGESGALSRRDFEAAESFARGAAWQYKQDLDRFLHCKNAYFKLNDEVCQILGKALRYPWYKDDQKTFPKATEKDGVCVGDQVAESLAQQAANRIQQLEKALTQTKAEQFIESSPVKELSEDFRAGVKEFFSALLYRVANNWHGDPRVQKICEGENKLIETWAQNSLLDISTEDYYEWVSLQEMSEKIGQIGVRLSAAEEALTKVLDMVGVPLSEVCSELKIVSPAKVEEIFRVAFHKPVKKEQ